MNGNKMPTQNFHSIQPVEQRALFGAEIDDITPPPSEPRARYGDLWALGPHLLLCGDATSKADVNRLLDAAPESPFLMVTDPPYGVNYETDKTGFAESTRRRGVTQRQLSMRRRGRIANDNLSDWSVALALNPAPVAYVWHSAQRVCESVKSVVDAGYAVRQHIVWVKDIPVLSRGHYNWQHENCLYAVRKSQCKIRGARFTGGNAEKTTWQIPAISNPITPAYDYYGSRHPTQKPTECFARPIRNHDAPVVIDMFVGSGTIFIAAERVERVALGIEIMPEYIDMAITRWEDYTGKTARLIERTEEVCNGRQIKGQA